MNEVTFVTYPSLKKKKDGAPGWLSGLSVMISRFVGSSPASGSVLTAQSLEPVSDSQSPSLSDSPPFMLCLSLSQK